MLILRVACHAPIPSVIVRASVRASRRLEISSADCLGLVARDRSSCRRGSTSRLIEQGEIEGKHAQDIKFHTRNFCFVFTAFPQFFRSDETTFKPDQNDLCNSVVALRLW